ncbi:NAD-binding protein [Enterococcus avium]|uniref:NAD-binding protein n=1 Tax=Enterococcus avium TaxID=33945 RepID=A0ABD5F8S7_ENTAV|nr:NAD-binding protein [Enterococcus avium]MDT2435951.1 NAD-binding protein [Enterococcus avium]MDT2465921.1 NAD-binding protein [Enterococcus avium]MDT2482978.1 NAD-binding protein [Enterococcus avium]MDT2505293.1 NAD-binding protein [Enterococcus avium]MDT2511313.1 NAD-binding protein [Enterococcus avium]
MRILLAGDSKQSWNIINVLLDNKQHRLTVINTDMAYCQQLADQYEELVILSGDSTELPTLEEANAKKIDMVIAMSLYDSENLVICKLCKKIFHIQNTIAIINCPQNMDIFRKLGVDTVIDTNAFILSCINRDITQDSVNVETK